MFSAAAIEVIQGDFQELSYLFPASLVDASTRWDEQKHVFAKLGVIPYGAFVFLLPQFDESSTKQVIEIPFLSVLPSFFSNQLVEEILLFIVEYLSLAPPTVLFNLSYTSGLPLLDNSSHSLVNYCNSRIIREVKLDFRQSLDHWKNLWKIFERNSTYLSRKYNIYTTTLNLIEHDFVSSHSQNKLPDWANPFNEGFYSPYNSPFNLVLILDQVPIAWLNAGQLNQSLLFENLWCYPHKHSAQFCYLLLYNLFTQFNDFNLTRPCHTCLFSYRDENQGMHKLAHRLSPFVSLSTTVRKMQVRFI